MPVLLTSLKTRRHDLVLAMPARKTVPLERWLNFRWHDDHTDHQQLRLQEERRIERMESKPVRSWLGGWRAERWRNVQSIRAQLPLVVSRPVVVDQDWLPSLQDFNQRRLVATEPDFGSPQSWLHTLAVNRHFHRQFNRLKASWSNNLNLCKFLN